MHFLFLFSDAAALLSLSFSFQPVVWDLDCIHGQFFLFLVERKTIRQDKF